MHVLPRWNCLAFIAICDASFSDKQAFSFLMELFIQFKSEFRQHVDLYRRGEALPVRYEFNSSLQPFLSHTIHRHNTTKLEDYDLVVFSLDDVEDAGLDTSSGPRIVSDARFKVPLLSQNAPVSQVRARNTHKRLRTDGSMNPVSAWLLRHPYLTIGFCIFVGVGLLLYFLVIVPLCGPRLEKRVDNNPESAYICWFSTSNSSDFSPPVNQTASPFSAPIFASPTNGRE